jgi:hypothetical protein
MRRLRRLSGLTLALSLSCGIPAAVALLPSCSSTSVREADFSDPDVAGRAANPDGVAYPTDHLGGVEHAGRRPGDRIPNFTFQGYVDGNREGGLRTISLADYFDPEQKRHKVLHLKVAATWCAYCSAELAETVKVKEELAAEGAAFLEVVVSGNALQAGPSLGEFDGWLTRHSTTLTTAIDVRARRMASVGIDGSVMPWDLLIDTRTMEILDSSGGAPADVKRYVRDGLAFVSKNPPGY